MDLNEDDYNKMPHDELLSLADSDRLAAEAFYYRYQYADDPKLKAEVRGILKSLAEDFEAMGFWLDWYKELDMSEDPKEREEAEIWRQRIIQDGGFDNEYLLATGIIEANELPYDEVLKLSRDNLLCAEAFYDQFKTSPDPKIKADVRSALKTLAEEGMIAYWPQWFCALRDSDDPAERLEAEEWRRKIIQEGAWDKEVLQFYGIDEDNESVGIDEVVSQLYAKYKAEVESERRREAEG